MRADVLDLQIDPFRLARGEERPHEWIRCVRAEGRRLLDVVGTTYAFLKLVSPRFIAVLEDHRFRGWTPVPVELDVRGGDGYAVLAVTGRAGPIDDALSERITIPAPVPQGEAGPGLRGLFFRRDTWDGSEVFTSQDRASIFVTPTVKEALETAGITGAEFERLSDIERPLLEEEADDVEA